MRRLHFDCLHPLMRELSDIRDMRYKKCRKEIFPMGVLDKNVQFKNPEVALNERQRIESGFSTSLTPCFRVRRTGLFLRIARSRTFTSDIGLIESGDISHTIARSSICLNVRRAASCPPLHPSAEEGCGL